MDIKEIYKHIDYTLLKPTVTNNDIWNLCEEAEKKHCASVCIPSAYVNFAREFFPFLTICTVVGFPFGNSTTEAKAKEAESAIYDGADEIDMVINIGDIKSGNYYLIKQEINTIYKRIEKIDDGAILKVIIETCYLTEKEIAIATKIVDESFADYVKTSTGFGSRDASFEDIEIIRANIHDGTKIKASGGIRTAEDMERYIEMGCDRIGASVLP